MKTFLHNIHLPKLMKTFARKKEQREGEKETESGR